MSALSEIVPGGTALTLEAGTFAIPGPAAGQAGSKPEPACRFAGEPLHWIRLPGAVSVPVSAMARSSRRVYQNVNPGLPDGTAGAAVLLEVSPLPGFIAGLLHHLAGGLPIQYVLLHASDLGGVAALDQETCVRAGEQVALPTVGAWFGVCLQDRICRDPRSWGAALAAAAEAGSIERSAGWTGFIAALAAASTPRVRLLDHVGRPLSAGTFNVSPSAGVSNSVTLTATSAGDTGIDVAGPGAAIQRPGVSDAILASADTASGAVGAALPLSATDRHVLSTRAFDWLAARSSGVTALERFTQGSIVEPIVDGTPYFARLVSDMRAAKAGGAVQLAGWVFVKESLRDRSKPWSLVPEDNTTELVALIGELVGGGADVRMLVNQFLQISDADLATVHTDAEVLLLGILALMGITQAARWITTDEAGWVGLVAAYTILPLLPDSTLRDLLRGIVETSKTSVDAINKAHPGTAVWTPYPVTLTDNPLAADPLVIAGIPVPVVHHFGVYHQKIAMTRPPGGAPIAYVGGIDINSDRVDDPLHRAIAPFHDVQVRVTGPAANEIAKVYAERAAYHGTTAPIAALPDSTTVAKTGTHLTQIGRTYFAPAPGSTSAPFPSAPQGEHTTHETLLQAIASARDFIYIEDQYFTPDDAYVDALVAAADLGLRRS